MMTSRIPFLAACHPAMFAHFAAAFRSLLPLWLILAVSAIECVASAAEFGIDKRTPWTTSKLVGSPEPPLPYLVERAFEHLTFQAPAEMQAVPGTNRLAILELKGKIYTFENRPDVTHEECDLMGDIAPRDPLFYRLYGLAFHPQFVENRTVYICYVLKPQTPDGSRVSRFKVTATDPPRLIPESEEVLITWIAGGHNGGHLQFGPDGYLYISTGDSGESFPPDGRNTGQNITDLTASILRIDVDKADAEKPDADSKETAKKYRIPADNPFVSEPAGSRGEVWAYGVRNPWKMCFNPSDGSLWVGDVGWEMWEMIYRIERGGNYGWSLMEASQPVHRERPRGPTPILPPTIAHDHVTYRSITGGYFSQTSRLPELKGAYVYGDYVTGIMSAAWHDGTKIVKQQTLVDTPLQIVSFGLDQQGEVLIVDQAGSIFRLTPNPRTTANTSFPQKLSETGLFASTKDHSPAPGVIPYDVNAEPWADGTLAERFVALPGSSQLDLWDKTDVQIGYIAGEWKFPDGGVLAKTVSLELEPGNASSRRRLETQVLHYDVDTWRAYNYVWNDEQTDAVLQGPDGFDRPFKIKDAAAEGGLRQQTWHHAGRTECILCHTTRAGSIHGFRLPQLNRDHNYADAGQPPAKANQLATLNHIGLFAKPLPEKLTAWVDPYDDAQPLDQRARAYLHINCAHCHRRGGGGSAAFDVQITTALEKSLLNTRPTQGTFDIHGAQIVAPGDPYRSVLYYRMMKLGSGRMPQFGSKLVDDRGTKLIRDWIDSLPQDESDAATKKATLLRHLSMAAVGEMLQKGKPDIGVFELLNSKTDDALLLATILRDGHLNAINANEEIIDAGISNGLASTNPVVRDLYERYVPEEQRTKKLGTTVKADDILMLPADTLRGKLLFAESKSVQCRNCHKVGEIGKQIGPDLNAIGKKLDKPKLLESMLEPSKTIDPKFAAQLVETSDGQVVTGLLVRQDDTQVVLRQIDGKETTVAVADVEVIAPQQKSLMPELLLQDLTAQQVADLLEYLSSLK